MSICYSFGEGNNTPPSYDDDMGEDITYELTSVVSWGIKQLINRFEWYSGNYGDNSFNELASKKILDCSVSYTEANASITIGYQ